MRTSFVLARQSLPKPRSARRERLSKVCRRQLVCFGGACSVGGDDGGLPEWVIVGSKAYVGGVAGAQGEAASMGFEAGCDQFAATRIDRASKRFEIL